MPRRIAAPSTAPAGATTGRRKRRPIQLGDEGYLWALIAIELALTAALRQKFRSAHGG